MHVVVAVAVVAVVDSLAVAVVALVSVGLDCPHFVVAEIVGLPYSHCYCYCTCLLSLFLKLIYLALTFIFS